MRTALLAVLFSCGLVGCGKSSTSNAVLDPALQVADQMRQHCIASSLDVLQIVAGYVGPAVGARDVDDVEDAAIAARCTFFGPIEGAYNWVCPARIVRGETVLIQLRLEYLVDGFPSADPAGAEELRVIVEAGGGFLEAEGIVHFRNVPGLGLVMNGDLGVFYHDGCRLDLELDDVTGQAVADLPGGPFAVLFTSGEADIDAQTPTGQPVTGTAGFAGRQALVALEVFGVSSHGEITLGQ